MSLKKYEIKNLSVLSILEDFRYTYRDMYKPEECCELLSPGLENSADQYTSEEEMRRIIALGENHQGAAEHGYSYPIKPDHYQGTHPEEYRKTYIALDKRLKEELGLYSSALSQLYPPKGFICWHNNANASMFNVIFTWSQDGDGWFKYVEPTTGEVITIQDEKGWNMKAGFFGAYGSGDVVYHAARTNCYRMTLSYVLGHDFDYWKDMIDYITEV